MQFNVSGLHKMCAVSVVLQKYTFHELQIALHYSQMMTHLSLYSVSTLAHFCHIQLASSPCFDIIITTLIGVI